MPHIHRVRAWFGTGGSIACRLGFVAIALSALMHGAMGQEAQIRKALADRLPQLPAADEVLPTPIPGVYEVRSGATVFYTDRNGDYVIRGDMLDTRHQTNLTEARIAKVSVIDFSKLPLQDAIVSTLGQGTRKLAVFADPDCPYCKQLEAMLRERDDITVYTFLMPILGPGSLDKAKAIWCAKDKGVAWRDWMRNGTVPVAQPGCDASALDRNLALGRKQAIRATPTLVFQDGARIDGAQSALQLERQMAEHGPAMADRSKVGAP
jgi:thiol:disulfide interchange protein DsbC